MNSKHLRRKRIRINHVVTVADIDGKSVMIAKDRTKTKSSTRTMPLIPRVEEYLLRLKKEQEQNRKLCGKCYCTVGCTMMCDSR